MNMCPFCMPIETLFFLGVLSLFIIWLLGGGFEWIRMKLLK